MGLKVALCACLPFPTSQGSQVLTHAVAQSLARLGHEVHLVTYAYGESRVDMEYRHHTAGSWIPARKLRAGPSVWKPLLDAAVAKKWLEVARASEADILHAINYEAALVGLWVRRRHRAPLVVSLHGMLDEELPFYFAGAFAKRLARRFGRWFMERIVPRADLVLTLNPRDAARLEEFGVSRDAARWHYPAVELAGELPRADEARRVLGWQGRRVILYAGNLDDYQGLDALAFAFREIADRRDDVILSVVTTSDPAPFLRRLAGLRERVVVLLTADFEVIKRAIAACDAFVVARPVSYGFPMKLLNALAVGAPVVIHRSCAYGVEHGREVWIYDGSWRSLVEALEKVLFDDDISSRLREGARSASERFDLLAMGGAIQGFYESLLA